MRTGFLTLLLVLTSFLGAEKLNLQKHYSNRPLRRHPYTQMLNKQPHQASKTRDANFNKLLVILVDFQEETPDDPLTTGNGKFLLEPDPAYLYSIGSPPHDRDYFQNNLEAMRYYYLAASAGFWDLQYDVWPQSGAYTLPQTMAWYNPPNSGGDLFVARMEKYFKDAFEIADSLSPEIDFSQYGHFMIIHAGSDWQHDTAGDTPSDIPSFFIRVGEGKEAFVDGGAVLIDHACNVPSTISQDFYTQTSGDQTFHGGYGALNAVLAHEFGHSVGAVDLYNVYTWQPMVGVFDIMDSGGSGILVDVLDDGSYVMLEGGLPGLPGAWSREQMFGDQLRSNGLLKEAHQLELFSGLSLAASSHKQSGNNLSPQILRLPLSPTEYLLVENRSVDPDGDGATAVKATSDGRVILYPTAINDPQDNPTYEYDYLLPSFQREDGSSVGGGILAWRINDDVIHSQGVTGSDGTFTSNFENNTINTKYTQRGVEIIEADNLPDIGYQWSWYWTGTQYEYFHGKKPVLNTNGYFQNWSLEPWKPQLNSETSPPLRDSKGNGSLYWLSGMGNPGAMMDISVRTGFFQSTQIKDFAAPDIIAGPLINSSFSNLDLPVLSSESITLLSQYNGEWVDLMGPFGWNGQPLDQPLLSADQDRNGFKELLLVHGNSLEIVEFSTDGLESRFINYPDPLTTAPIALGDTVFVSTPNCVSSVLGNEVSEFVSLSGTRRLGSYGNDLVAIGQDLLHILDRRDLYIKAEVELPEPFGDYEPVSFTASSSNLRMLFLMANSGNIYKFQNNQLQRIFTHSGTPKPTQMGITWHPVSSGAVNPAVFWAAGNRIYAVKHDGTLLSGYPYNAYPLEFAAGKHVYAIASYPSVILYLPLPQQGHVAYLHTAGIQWQKSLLANADLDGRLICTSSNIPEAMGLHWYYSDPAGRLFIHTIDLYALNHAIYWNGFRNGGSGNFEGYQLNDEIPPTQVFDAYVFPNPVRDAQFRVHIENFDQAVELRLFDINGSLLQNLSLSANGILRRDVSIDSGKLASGVYILSLQKGDSHKRIKFAVEK